MTLFQQNCFSSEQLRKLKFDIPNYVLPFTQRTLEDFNVC